MTRLLTPAAATGSGPQPGWGSRTAAHIRTAIEVVVLALACLAPWAFGAGEPLFEFVLYLGLAVVLLLWAARILLEWRLSLRKCPLALCLLGLAVLALWQLLPLPRPVLQRLSPNTAGVYDRLLPAEQEVLPGGEPANAVMPAPGTTLSLYPGATRQEFVRLVAVLLLFLVVRNNVTGPPCLERLCVVALVNGALLALFALVQFFSAPPDLLYWTYRVPTRVFGPFISRNHYPFYLNVCIGLGAGLLVGSRNAGGARVRFTAGLDFLQNPRVLWISAALALMVSSVLVCLSRGGILALLGGVAVCLGLVLFRPGRSRSSGLVLAAVAALALVGWFGYDQVRARLETVWKGDAWRESRIPLWSHSLPLVKDFPVWGTGYGTYPHVEPWHRDAISEDETVYDHAHNEYLEALVEGGVLRLGLSLTAIGLVYWLGWRAVHRHPGGRGGGLALGGLFGVTTLVAHSFGDFGLHIPAVAVLATVVCAELCALGDGEPGAGEIRHGGLAPLLGVGFALLAVFLAAEGWRAYTVQRFRLTAARLAAEHAGRAGQIACLEAGARLAPEYARLQVELAQAHLDACEEAIERMDRESLLSDLAGAMLAAAPTGAGPAFPTVVAAATSLTGAGIVRAVGRAEAEQQLTRRHRVPALRHYLHARDACPAMGKPHVRLAANVELLDRADPRNAYLRRAQFLCPADPELWYLCGLQEILDGHADAALADWRRCLELTDGYLVDVLARAGRLVGPRGVLDRVLPEKPDLLVRAALHYYPDPKQNGERRPFLDKALAVIASRPGALSAADFHSKALVHAVLGQSAEALAAFRTATALAPQQIAWRYEFAQLLYERQRYDEARGELLAVLGRQPAHAQALELLETITREERAHQATEPPPP
jgi:O-antigen ligase/tetratricopeptide (TPR) repeat protein